MLARLCLAGLVSLFLICPTTRGEEVALQPVRTIIVDDDVWPHFNWASFDQDKIISYGNHQYSIYWDADKVLVVARRDLRNQQVQSLRLLCYTQTVDSAHGPDGHRNTVVGISPGDGRLHLSWDHHVNDLRYTKTRKGFLTNPPDKISAEDFEPAQPLAPGAPQKVTYPCFFNDAQGRLYFVYRSGGSGSGVTVIARYDQQDGTWKLSAGLLFGKEGTYAAWNSKSRNAYTHDILFDKNNRLHMTWVYRESYISYASNHDLHYVYSDDFGVTWMNNNEEKIADLSRNDPILISDPGIVVQKIPVYSWLMNQCAMTLDSKSQPHVALFKLPDTYKPRKNEPDLPPSVFERLRFFHYWRGTDGTWHNSGPLDMPKGLKVSRPNIVMDSEDRVFIYWASAQGFRCYVANAAAEWKDWKMLSLTGPEFTANDASKHDRRLLLKEGVLSFTANPKGGNKGSGYCILDFDLKAFVLPCPAAPRLPGAQ